MTRMTVRKNVLFDFNGMPIAKGLPVLLPTKGKKINDLKLTVGTVIDFTEKDRVKVLLLGKDGQPVGESYYHPKALYIYGVPPQRQEEYHKYCERVAKRTEKEIAND